MARRLTLLLSLLTALLAGGCATLPQQPVALSPHFDGVYRLSYSGSGSALYYRFFADGTVLSARSEAPAFTVIQRLSPDNEVTSRGTWQVQSGELRIGVDEGTVSYDSRFQLREDGRIALLGLPRAFEFIPFDGQGQALLSRR